MSWEEKYGRFCLINRAQVLLDLAPLSLAQGSRLLGHEPRWLSRVLRQDGRARYEHSEDLTPVREAQANEIGRLVRLDVYRR